MAFSKNLCQSHYHQADHPLKATWKTVRSRHVCPPEWNSFAAFLADVGERPTPQHQLRRVNEALPHSAANVKWLPPIQVAANDNYSQVERSQYSRAWNLSKRFDLTIEQYDAMLANQGGTCACCGGVETHKYASGKVKALSVDHDHQTEQVRGLLCVNCNRAIGYFDDSPQRMRAAADYLDRHNYPESIFETAGLSAGFLF